MSASGAKSGGTWRFRTAETVERARRRPAERPTKQPAVRQALRSRAGQGRGCVTAWRRRFCARSLCRIAGSLTVGTWWRGQREGPAVWILRNLRKQPDKPARHRAALLWSLRGSRSGRKGCNRDLDEAPVTAGNKAPDRNLRRRRRFASWRKPARDIRCRKIVRTMKITRRAG